MGEALSTKWTDIDLKTKTVKINNPEKHGNTRTLPISNNLIAMLNSLKKRKDNNVFNPNESSISTTFFRSRRRIAKKLQNKRLLQIHFHTLRHRKATNEYYKTKDILHVKYILGHKSLTSTQQYAHYQSFQEEEYTCKTAKTVEEATKLIEAGFRFETEIDRIKLFRKRK
jgi:integrase